MLVVNSSFIIRSYSMAKKRKVVRSAITGKFVKKSKAKSNPKTTVTETVRTRKKKR